MRSCVWFSCKFEFPHVKEKPDDMWILHPHMWLFIFTQLQFLTFKTRITSDVNRAFISHTFTHYIVFFVTCGWRLCVNSVCGRSVTTSSECVNTLWRASLELAQLTMFTQNILTVVNKTQIGREHQNNVILCCCFNVQEWTDAYSLRVQRNYMSTCVVSESFITWL